MQIHQDGIHMKNITKDFAGKVALADVNIHIEKGTIHSIVGENGAGKSTLMKILSGALLPSKGEIIVNGQTMSNDSKNSGQNTGIEMVHQHFMLIPSLQIWQNIVLGVEPNTDLGFIDKKKAIEKINKACELYGVELDLEKTVSDLTVGEKQRVEIIKVLYREAEFIILDEPTAVLTPSEIDMLLGNIKSLRDQGKTIIFISHKLDEVLSISDKISVLRQGEYIGTVDAEDADPDMLVNMMVGRAISIDAPPLKTKKGECVLKLDNVTTKSSGYGCALRDVSLNVCEGEILGIAGVDGNGQLELVESIMGLLNVKSGNITIKGEKSNGYKNKKIRSLGVSCIPPDRHTQGLVLDSSITRNTILGCEELKELKDGIFISPKKAAKKTSELMKEFDVRFDKITKDIKELSGGNQQKVILARECGLQHPDLIIAVNPTRGLDVGAIKFVYEQLEKYKAEGKAILLVSTELSEVLRLSDRVAVMFEGEIMDTLVNNDMDINLLGSLMMGIKKGVESV